MDERVSHPRHSTRRDEPGRDVAAQIVWLASYPKSGSTWLRVILGQIVAPYTGRWKAIPSFVKGPVPAMSPVVDFHSGPTAIIKTHCTPDHKNLVDIGAACVGAISIYRHPLDILLSSLNYLGFKGATKEFRGGLIKTVDEILSGGEIDHYIDRFIEHDGLLCYAGMSGRWSLYQTQWDEFGAGVDYLKLRYEDMVANPIAGVKSIYNFLGAEHDTVKIEEILSLSEQNTAIDGRFFWRKRPYNYRSIVPSKSISRFSHAFADQLLYLGYDPER